jgi:hypothetical protein
LFLLKVIMDLVHVTVYSWDWEPIGQVSLDISFLYQDGEIDRGVLDEVARKAALPLLKGDFSRDVRIFVHRGDRMSPEDLLEAARQEYQARGPDVEVWPIGRRIKNTQPIRKH